MGKDLSKNHIVPKRYLDRFAEKGSSKRIIGTRVFENDTPKFFQSSTDNVGFITDFYDATDRNDKKYWEKFFARTQDSLCGEPLQEFISVVNMSCHQATVMTDAYKDMLSRIIVSQMFRVPAGLDFVKRIYKKTLTELKEELLSVYPEDRKEQLETALEKAKLSDQQQKELFFNQSFDPKHFDMYCKILKKRLWCVLYNRCSTTMPFVTSDNPVLVENLFTGDKSFYENGLLNFGTIIFYPVSKEIAVTNFSFDGMNQVLSLRAAMEFGEEYYVPPSITAELLADKLFYIDDLKYVVYKNRLVLNQAFQHGFLPQPLYDMVTNA